MDGSLRRLFRLLLLVVLMLLALHFFPKRLSATIDDRFNLDAEANIPAWYSTVLLFSVSLSSFSVYILAQKGRGRELPWRWFWLVLGAAYCFLSLDEAARLHEIIDTETSVKWTFVYGPFAGVFFLLCVFYFAGIRRADKGLRNWILGGLIVYALGGLISETIGHFFHPLPPMWQRLELVCEEGLEMVGTILVLRGCLHESLKRLGIALGDQDNRQVSERIDAYRTQHGETGFRQRSGGVG
jgi:hypothetical protein